MQTEPRKTETFSNGDRRIYLALVASLTGLVVWLSLTLHHSADKVVALQEQRDLAAVRVALTVPAEVLYCDEQASQELAQLRFSMFERQGIDRFVPYSFALDRLSSSDEISIDDERVAMPTDDLAVVGRGILENSWVRMVLGTCESLLLERHEGEGAGGYLAANPEVFEAQVKPSLVRLTQSARPLMAVSAARVLLAWEPGSTVATEALDRLEAQRDQLSPEVQERLEQARPGKTGE